MADETRTLINRHRTATPNGVQTLAGRGYVGIHASYLEAVLSTEKREIEGSNKVVLS